MCSFLDVVSCSEIVVSLQPPCCSVIIQHVFSVQKERGNRRAVPDDESLNMPRPQTTHTKRNVSPPEPTSMDSLVL